MRSVPSLLILGALATTVSACGAQSKDQPAETPGSEAPQAASTPSQEGIPPLGPDEIKAVRERLAGYVGVPAAAEDKVVMITSAGTIKLRLFVDLTPVHANNFKRLANSGFYDSTRFHRVVPGFVIQGGDILSRDGDRSNDGQGGPGYTIPAEFNPRPHVPGSLAMARSSDPNSAGSQFYIALERLPQLDNKYTVFGEVTEGMEVVRTIGAAPRDARDNPLEPQWIYSVRVNCPSPG